MYPKSQDNWHRLPTFARPAWAAWAAGCLGRSGKCGQAMSVVLTFGVHVINWVSLVPYCIKELPTFHATIQVLSMIKTNILIKFQYKTCLMKFDPKIHMIIKNSIIGMCNISMQMGDQGKPDFQTGMISAKVKYSRQKIFRFDRVTWRGCSGCYGW